MPKFRITSPDGRTFDVTGPEGSTREEALARVITQQGQGQQPAAEPRPEGIWDTESMMRPSELEETLEMMPEELGAAYVSPEHQRLAVRYGVPLAGEVPLGEGPTASVVLL